VVLPMPALPQVRVGDAPVNLRALATDCTTELHAFSKWSTRPHRVLGEEGVRLLPLPLRRYVAPPMT
jgi:hypothetical protein